MATSHLRVALAVLAVACSHALHGMVDFSIPLGTPEGDGNRAMPFRTDDPDTIPDGLKWLSIEEIRGGRLEIVKGRPTYIRFYRDGVEVPVREYVLIPGKTVFTLIYRYQGKDKRKTNWTFLPDGWCDIEQFDAEGNILSKWQRLRVETDTHLTVEIRSGGVVTREELEKVPGHGNLLTFSSRGTGPNQVWERKAYYHDGPGYARCRSEIDSDGNWTMYEYCWDLDPHCSTNSSFSPTSVVMTPIDGAKAITNAEGAVVGFIGKAHRTEYDYAPLVTNAIASRASPSVTVEYEVTSDGKKKELSRRYHATAPATDGDGKDQIVINEVATVPGAPFGSPTNRRTVRRDTLRYSFDDDFRRWHTVYEISPEGNIHWTNAREVANDGLVRRIFEEFDTTTNAPAGTPYRTVLSRRLLDQYKHTVREESWILLPDGDRELLTWKNIRRDEAGRELSTENSEGEQTEKIWEDARLVAEKDAEGLERQWKYDAIGRMVQSAGNVYEHNRRYDLGSYITNAYGSVFGVKYDYSISHDDAGRLADVTGEPGEKYETEEGADGVTRTRLNGKLIRSSVTKDGATTVYIGPKGLDSPRWYRYSHDPEGRFSVHETPRLGGGTVSVTNWYGHAEGRDDSRVETDTIYQKIRGCWWKEDSSVKVCGTNRTFAGARRTRISGRRIDGMNERVEVDSKHHETRYLRRMDAASKTLVEFVYRPTATLPEIDVSSNGVTVLSVSSSGVTNSVERGFQERISSTTDGRGGKTLFEYDAQGMLSAVTDRSGRRRAYVHARNGRLLSETLPSGKIVRFSYDDFGRMVSEACDDEKVVRKYDEYGDLVAVTAYGGGKETGHLRDFRDEATGLVTNQVVNGRSRVFVYDEKNRLKSIDGIDLAAAAVARTNGLEVVRDEFGRSIGYAVRGVRKLTQSYDARTGRISGFVVEGLGEVKISYLQGTDLVECLSYPNGVSARFLYDAEERPLRVAWTGLPSGDCTFESAPPSEWRGFEPEDDWDFLSQIPIAEDPQVYARVGSGRIPVAVLGEDGKLQWCLLDAECGRIGLFDEKEVRR